LSESEPLGIAAEIPDERELPALLLVPEGAHTLLVLAHGAGAGMHHPFMQSLAIALADNGVATLRWDFPYMAAGLRRPDRPAVAVAAVRRAVAWGRRLRDERIPLARLVAGGKSFGGRMTSTAAAEAPLGGVSGLALVGFPVHPVGRPDTQRAAHLSRVSIPVLVLQGTRDKMGSIDLLAPIVATLPPGSMLHVEDDADHGFHVRKRSGRDDNEVIRSLAGGLAQWTEGR
jgi:predicted alpha/beta-hydrolase family hydrolase